ncbi:MAG: 50S ribosomal protein L35 [Hydrogenibacillus schlegelii]|uniref:Large ribosomal subunit protein bL35 n=1 Tax=Hydrogenibacillus schlegelii TaxID=1484 RepID=A0A2T5GBP5_HYDSH|nr:50S ribosomal protein L35 [Hydrogenibacillus schlegelii]MBE3563827.1 50S ribosomal protein L35 [Hydrogenibacillus schlegelii]MBT9282279.1 50S ribosomal protein L35 [Hydrogenibacillus schlegelii]PTQ53614.1 MAG: LSU ribosomal protein L35p [Hydrogenibacillus schlegelii]
MPKMKTHRGAAKRFKKTGSGKLIKYRANKSHLLTHKNAKRKRRLRGESVLKTGDYKRTIRLLPY